MLQAAGKTNLTLRFPLGILVALVALSPATAQGQNGSKPKALPASPPESRPADPPVVYRNAPAPQHHPEAPRDGSFDDSPHNGPRRLSETRPLVVVQPRPIRTTKPDDRYWRSRDLFRQIQAMARRGRISVTPVDGRVAELRGYVDLPEGWKAYGFAVPPKGKLHVRLFHQNQGWFRLAMMNKWGDLERGMLQNLISTGNPEVTFDNPADKAIAVYVLVDDPGLMSREGTPYTMKLDRSWSPEEDLPASTVLDGIWASKEELEKKDPEKKG